MSRTHRKGSGRLWWRSPRSRALTYWKQATKRKHRMRERMALDSGRWDDLGHKSYQRADDIWNWD